MRSGIAVACLVASLGALVFACGGASAHGGALEVSPWLGEEPAVVELHGAPLAVADVPLELLVTLPEREEPTDVRVEWTSPRGVASGVETLAAQSPSVHVGGMRFPEPGAWRLTLRVDGEQAEVDVDVHPAGRYFVDPAEALASRGALVAGGEHELALRVSTADGYAPPSATDALATIERWDAAGERLLGEETVPLREASSGVYVARGAWDEPGLLRIRVESATWGLATADRPSVDVLVVPAEDVDIYSADETHKVPAPGIGALLLGLACLALARRRRA